MAQPPPPYGSDPNNPYGQQPAPQQPQQPQQQPPPPPSYTPPPPANPYGGSAYEQPQQPPYQQPPSYAPPPPYTPPAAYGGAPDSFAPQPVQYGAPGVSAAGANNTLALVSMICGIAGLVLMFLCGIGFLPAVAGVVMGFIARNQINQTGGVQSGSGQALAGIITGGVAVALSIIVFIIFLISGVLANLSNG